VKGNCDEVLKDVHEKFGEYGRGYFEDRLIIEPVEIADAPDADDRTVEN